MSKYVVLDTERYNNKILPILKNDISTFFCKGFLIFNDSSLTFSNRTYQYFKIPHERERRRKNLKWCLTRKKNYTYVGNILWKTGYLKKLFIRLIKLTYNLVVHAVPRWTAKRFSAMVPCCPDEGRNFNSEIAPDSLKILIATVSLIIFSIKVLWYEKLILLT